MNEGNDEANTDKFANSNKHDEPTDCYLRTMLLRAKKRKDKNVKHKKQNNKDKTETNYHRLMFLGDPSSRPVCLIEDDI